MRARDRMGRPLRPDREKRGAARSDQWHARDDRAGGESISVAGERRRVPAADGDRQPARHAALHRSRGTTRGSIADRPPIFPRAQGDQAPPVRRRAGTPGDDAQGHQGDHAHAVPRRSFSRVSPSVARRICHGGPAEHAGLDPTIGREEADSLYQAIQETKISAPSTDCISPIGEELLLKGLHRSCRASSTVRRPVRPAVYRGNPFQIEVALAYGGGSPVRKSRSNCSPNCLHESDARTLRQFLINTFDGLGPEAAPTGSSRGGIRHPQSPASCRRRDDREAASRHAQYQPVRRAVDAGAALRQSRPAPVQTARLRHHRRVINTNWRSYGLSQSRGSFPTGRSAIMVHIASVWVPFTSESKEAIASYPEIQKELRLGLQAVGRKLGMYLRRRKLVQQEGERRNIFLRYLGEVASAVSDINGADQDKLYNELLDVAKRKTAEADLKLDDRGVERLRGGRTETSASTS
jgi:DNA topoisomerase VI subunit B